MSNKSKYLIIALILIGIVIIGVAISLIMGKQSTEEAIQHSAFVPLPQLPEAGTEYVLLLSSGHEDGTAVEGVEVNFIDVNTGTSVTQTTNQSGRTQFTLICGNTYEITAHFNNSEAASEYTLECNEVGGVIVSNEGIIGSIIFETIPNM